MSWHKASIDYREYYGLIYPSLGALAFYCQLFKESHAGGCEQELFNLFLIKSNNNFGRAAKSIAQGAYLFRLESNGTEVVKKMMIK